MTNIIFDKLIIDVKSIVSKNRSSLNDDEVATLEEVVRVLNICRELVKDNESIPIELIIKIVDLATKFMVFSEQFSSCS